MGRFFPMSVVRISLWVSVAVVCMLFGWGACKRRGSPTTG
ncbi:putative membrane protein [Mycobacterium kansasii]|uniref:Putative membrane protein n=1 Tax=Mycobacterium kansasii TaxID=1768 RepID=A0A1V3X170_MYCKA|nr:putative membrane protein [Mycobacterium kansasii]